MDLQNDEKFENFLRSRLKVRVEFLEKYAKLFPELVEMEEFQELLAKTKNLKDLNLASLYLLEIEINEIETDIQNLLKEIDFLSLR